MLADSSFERFFKRRRVLCIAPHADDEMLGCGGLMARASEVGAEVFILVVSVGDLVRVGEGDNKVAGVLRRDELQAAAKVVGATDWELAYDDEERHLRLDAIPRRDLTALLERDARLSLTRLKPHIVLLPALSYNQDHEAVLRAGLVACRPHDPQAKPVPDVWLYEYPPLSWNLRHESFHPGIYVDISKHLDKKLEAYACHRSQIRQGVHQNTLHNVETLARLRGKEVGVEAAEAYEVMRLCL